MASTLKPIVLYGGKLGPNPSKVIMILTELGLDFEISPVAMSDVKTPAYVAVNPNGRLPAIRDPNTGLTLWESGAIIEYLISHYDTSHKISFPANSPEDWHTKQWLYFQVSGQGPYYGNAVFFMRYHHEKLPSAVERFAKEAKRVTGVLESVLQDKKWLVGDKCTYADLAFIPWQNGMKHFVTDIDMAKEFPNVEAWMQRMRDRPVIKKLLEEYATLMAASVKAREEAAAKAK